MKSDVHFLVAGIFDLVGSNITVYPWPKQTKYVSSPRWPKYPKNSKNEWRPPRKSHSRWDIIAHFLREAEKDTLRAQRARHYAVLWCFLGNQTCRVSNSTPICNDCATLFFQSGAHTFLARVRAGARARARRGRRKAKTYRDPDTKVKEKWNFRISVV